MYIYLSIYLSIYVCAYIPTYLHSLELDRQVRRRGMWCTASAAHAVGIGECLRLMRVRAGWMGLAVCTLLRKVHMHSTYIPHTYIQNSSRRTGVYVCVCVFIYLCRTPTTFLLCPVAPYLLCSALLCSSLLLSTFLDKIQTQIQTQAETDAGADAVQYRAVPCCVTWTIDV